MSTADRAPTHTHTPNPCVHRRKKKNGLADADTDADIDRHPVPKKCFSSSGCASGTRARASLTFSRARASQMASSSLSASSLETKSGPANSRPLATAPSLSPLPPPHPRLLVSGLVNFLSPPVHPPVRPCAGVTALHTHARAHLVSSRFPAVFRGGGFGGCVRNTRLYPHTHTPAHTTRAEASMWSMRRYCTRPPASKACP